MYLTLGHQYQAHKTSSVKELAYKLLKVKKYRKLAHATSTLDNFAYDVTVIFNKRSLNKHTMCKYCYIAWKLTLTVVKDFY